MVLLGLNELALPAPASQTEDAEVAHLDSDLPSCSTAWFMQGLGLSDVNKGGYTRFNFVVN